MRAYATEMGADETGLKYIDEVLEFETKLANVCFFLHKYL